MTDQFTEAVTKIKKMAVDTVKSVTLAQLSICALLFGVVLSGSSGRLDIALSLLAGAFLAMLTFITWGQEGRLKQDPGGAKAPAPPEE